MKFKNSCGFCRHESKSLWSVVLLLFVLFSCQAPVTPGLSFLVNGQAVLPSMPIIPEDLSDNGGPGNGTVYEHLAVHYRRKDVSERVYLNLSRFVSSVSDLNERNRFMASAYPVPVDGRSLLTSYCILRT